MEANQRFDALVAALGVLREKWKSRGQLYRQAGISEHIAVARGNELWYCEFELAALLAQHAEREP